MTAKEHYEGYLRTKEMVETAPGEYADTGREMNSRAVVSRSSGKVHALLDEAMFSHTSPDAGGPPRKHKRKIRAWRDNGKVYMELVIGKSTHHIPNSLIDLDKVFAHKGKTEDQVAAA